MTYDGLTDPLGESQILPYLTGLSKKNIQFTIVSFEKTKNYESRRYAIEGICNKHNIQWIPLKYTKKPPIISTIYDIYKLKSTTKQLLRNNNVDLIHCRSYITSLIGLWAKRKHKTPFIFDMRGFWADERIDGNIWNINNPIHKIIFQFFKRKEKEFLQESITNISLTFEGKKEIESWPLPSTSPIKVIPCCTDENLFNSSNTQLINKKDLGINEDDFILSYVGSIGTWYMLDEMLDFFIQLSKYKPNCKFLFITKDAPDQIISAIEKKGISKNQIIITSVNRELMPSYISLSNCSIFFIKALYSKKASSPTKMGEILNMGVPIICNKGVGDVDILMNELDSNLIIKDFTHNNYKIVSEYLIHLTWNKEKAIKASINYFSLQKGIETYYKVYNSLSSN